jgi:hypothetical protein
MRCHSCNTEISLIYLHSSRSFHFSVQQTTLFTPQHPAHQTSSLSALQQIHLLSHPDTKTSHILQNGRRSFMRKCYLALFTLLVHSHLPRSRASCAQLEPASWPSLTRSALSSMLSSVSSLITLPFQTTTNHASQVESLPSSTSSSHASLAGRVDVVVVEEVSVLEPPYSERPI